MPTLDDIFHKEARDYTELKQTETQLAKAVVITWAVCLFSWILVWMFDPTAKSDLLIGIVLIFTIFPLFIAGLLATPLNLIPYKDFNYRERFLRFWLICLIIIFTLMTMLGFFALFVENFSDTI